MNTMVTPFSSSVVVAVVAVYQSTAANASFYR
jgi:hypothetical protein